jgi:hypothetical protein
MQSNTSLNTSFPAAEHGAAAGDNQPAAVPSASGDPAEDEKDEGSGGSSTTFSSIFNAATGFMSLAAKEWLGSLVNQPTEPPFGYNAKFDNELVRVVRLVVMVVLLTGIVVGSERLLVAKTAPTLVVALAMKVLIAAFLAAIVYSIFAFFCGVRVWETQRKRLTTQQIFFSILYIFVPWVPIFAFLWSVGSGGGTIRLLALTLALYLCIAYMILNFAKALRRVCGCPWYRVWLSVLSPIVLVLGYVLFRT